MLYGFCTICISVYAALIAVTPAKSFATRASITAFCLTLDSPNWHGGKRVKGVEAEKERKVVTGPGFSFSAAEDDGEGR